MIKKAAIILAGVLALTACSGGNKEKAEDTAQEQTIDLNEPNIAQEIAMLHYVDPSPEAKGLGEKSWDMPLIVDFSATWCPPCQKLKPEFDALAEKYIGQCRMVSIDVDKYPYIAERFGIKSIPTILFINKKALIKERVTGYIGPEELENKVSDLMAD